MAARRPSLRNEPMIRTAISPLLAIRTVSNGKEIAAIDKLLVYADAGGEHSGQLTPCLGNLELPPAVDMPPGKMLDRAEQNIPKQFWIYVRLDLSGLDGFLDDTDQHLCVAPVQLLGRRAFVAA